MCNSVLEVPDSVTAKKQWSWRKHKHVSLISYDDKFLNWKMKKIYYRVINKQFKSPFFTPL